MSWPSSICKEITIRGDSFINVLQWMVKCDPYLLCNRRQFTWMTGRFPNPEVVSPLFPVNDEHGVPRNESWGALTWTRSPGPIPTFTLTLRCVPGECAGVSGFPADSSSSHGGLVSCIYGHFPHIRGLCPKVLPTVHSVGTLHRWTLGVARGHDQNMAKGEHGCVARRSDQIYILISFRNLFIHDEWCRFDQNDENFCNNYLSLGHFLRQEPLECSY